MSDDMGAPISFSISDFLGNAAPIAAVRHRVDTPKIAVLNAAKRDLTWRPRRYAVRPC